MKKAKTKIIEHRKIGKQSKSRWSQYDWWCWQSVVGKDTRKRYGEVTDDLRYM